MINIQSKIRCATTMNKALMELLGIAKDENDLEMLGYITRLSEEMKPLLANVLTELNTQLK